MTNDVIATAPNCKESLRLPKFNMKDCPNVWAAFFHLLTPTMNEKKLNTKAMITHKNHCLCI